MTFDPQETDLRVLVVGHESSGSRWLARLIDDTPGVQVVHRSQPHGGEWMHLQGFMVNASVAIRRAVGPSCRSMVEAGHCPDVETAQTQRAEAIRTMAFAPNVVMIEYEALVADPRAVLDFVGEHLGVAIPDPVELPVDGNPKWD